MNMLAIPKGPEDASAAFTLLIIRGNGGKIHIRNGGLYVTGIKPIPEYLGIAIRKNKVELIRMAGDQ